MARSKHVPIRTCIFCGKKASKYELWRLVLDEEGRPIWDEKQRLPGRGSYVCAREACIRKMETQKGKRRLSSAFKGRMRGENPALITMLIKALGGRKENGKN